MHAARYSPFTCAAAIGVGQTRMAAADLELAGGHLKIAAGTVLWVPIHAMHNSLLNWDEPDAFKPGDPALSKNLCFDPCCTVTQLAEVQQMPAKLTVGPEDSFFAELLLWGCRALADCWHGAGRRDQAQAAARLVRSAGGLLWRQCCW